jgi:hypothetical protein
MLHIHKDSIMKHTKYYLEKGKKRDLREYNRGGKFVQHIPQACISYHNDTLVLLMYAN